MAVPTLRGCPTLATKENMFDLEKSIVTWRRQMLGAGIKFPSPMDELDIHLREEMERQMKIGLNEQAAFETAVQKIGQPQILKVEFKKSERIFMNQSMKTGAGIIGLLAGMALMTPGTIQLRHEMIMATTTFGLWLLGWPLVGGSVIFLQRICRPNLFPIESKNVELKRGKQAVKVGAGITVLLMGTALWLPAAAQAVQQNAVNFEAICFLTFGGALVITGAVVAFCPYKKRVA